MNTNMTGFGWLSKKLCILVLWMKVASALEGLRILLRYCILNEISHFYHIVEVLKRPKASSCFLGTIYPTFLIVKSFLSIHLDSIT